MALKRTSTFVLGSASDLAVPSYGAMALKRQWGVAPQSERRLAVPSYGAMALKPGHVRPAKIVKTSCSPLLRGDGPETLDE